MTHYPCTHFGIIKLWHDRAVTTDSTEYAHWNKPMSAGNEQKDFMDLQELRLNLPVHKSINFGREFILWNLASYKFGIREFILSG